MGTALLAAGFDDFAVSTVAIGGLVWTASTLPLLWDYRHRADATPLSSWRRVLGPLLVAVAFGVIAGVVTGVWMLAVLPSAQCLILLNWPSGVRLRLVLAVTVVMVALWIVDARADGALRPDASWGLFGFYTVFLPGMTVVSLWWWDVLIALDRARVSEARLAATQERLRVATDVHDLQGHHLQVIALQLELAERLMASDPDAALEQLRAGRASVDEARQGTRDLALRFRSVPLADEIANAVDLLHAAGTTATASIDADVDRAPADVFGPVIRETTTNVLRHGAGGWARLSLERVGANWRYEIVNDVAGIIDDHPSARADGAGLEGLRRRATEARGEMQILRDAHSFTVMMNIPAHQTVSS